MSNKNDTDFHFMAGHQMSFAEIATAWMAFKELRRRNAIVVDFCGDAREYSAAERAGWQLGLRGKTRMRQYLERMEADPFGFFRGYEWGVDLYVKGTMGRLTHPHVLCALLTEVCSAQGEMPPTFGEADVMRAANQFRECLRIETEIGNASTAAVETYQTSPFVLPNPLQAFVREYGIAKGEVYVRRTIPPAPGPSVPVCSVKRVYPKGGTLWGDVIFADETGDVVVWKNVFHPARTRERARKLIERLQASAAREGGAAERRERKCPFCAEAILVEARLCKHCHQKVE